MEKTEWVVAFEKQIVGPVKYIGKFGSWASLYGYLHFNPIAGTLLTAILNVPED